MPTQEQIRLAARAAARELTGKNLGDCDGLISTGLIDSLSVLRLIALLETKLGISIPSTNLQPDDFDSIDYMVETVERVTDK